MSKSTVAIVGLGALGILYGQHLTEKLGKESVRIIVNEERKERYTKKGIYLNGKLCDFNYVLEDEEINPVDVIMVCTKSTTLSSGMETMKHQVGKNTTILSLINGISSEEILGERFGSEKVILTVAIGMDATREGQAVRSKVKGWLQIGADVSKKNEHLQKVIEIFDEADFPYEVSEDITLKLWEKFVMNVGVNQVVMVKEGTYSSIQPGGEHHDLMIQAMREVIPVAQAEGVNLTDDHIQKAVEIIDKVDPTGMPSMRQDGLAKRATEVELFSGTILAKSKEHGLESPVNEYLYKEVKRMEVEYL